MRHSMVRLAVVAATAVFLTSCGNGHSSAGSNQTTTPVSATITVHTVDLLKSAATKLAAAYTADEAGAKATVVVDTPAVVTKALADKDPEVAILPYVYLKDKSSAVHATQIGRDLGVIVVSDANPHHVADVTAFGAKSGLRTAVCGAKTAYGNFAQLLLQQVHVSPNPYTIGSDAGCPDRVMNLVAKGSLDAALLFRVGLQLPKGVKIVSIPDSKNLIAAVFVVTINPSAADSSFAKFLGSDAAHTILTKEGYLP